MKGIDTIIDLAPMPDPQWMQDYNIIPASTTSLSTMDTCPMKFNGSYGVTIEKVPYVQSKDAIFGDLVHQSAENYLLYGAEVPETYLKEMLSFQHKLDWVKKHKAFDPDGVEVQLATNLNHSPIWRTRALGVKADVLIKVSERTMIYIDWKTDNTVNWKGKPKSPNPKPIQLELTAIILFHQYPKLQNLICTLEFLRHDQKYTYIFERQKDSYRVVSPTGLESLSDFSYPVKISKYWAIQKSKQFRPAPCGLCKGWCEVSTCQHWEPKTTEQRL